MSKSKQIGTTAETYLVNYLLSEGFADAERLALAGANDRGDVRAAGVIFECKGGATAKGASDGLVTGWLAETERERQNASAGLGVLVLARASYGAKRVGQWWAIVPLWASRELLAGPSRDPNWESLTTLGAQPVRLHLSTLVELLKARATV